MTATRTRAQAAATGRHGIFKTGAAPRRRRSARKTARRAALNAIAIVVAVVTLFPIYWMVSTAFKPPTEIETLTPEPIPYHPTLSNFEAVINGTVAGMPYWDFLRNSLLVTLVAVAASSLLALLAAIALGRFQFRLRGIYLVMLLIVQMLPQQALVIALFIDFRGLNLLDSLTGLILVYTAFSVPVTVWMLRNFAAAVPKELEQAAQIDGAGWWTVFWRILLPLVSPGLVSTSVFAFIFAYNEFVIALTFLGTDKAKFTLPIYVQYFQGQYSTDWGAVMAASTLFTVPVLIFFVIIQRRLSSGLVAGAVKG